MCGASVSSPVRAGRNGRKYMAPEDLLNATPIILTLIFSCVYCFLGYRFLRFQLVLAGAVLGFNLAFMICSHVYPGQFYAMFVSAGVAAVAGALMFMTLYRAGIFCIGLVAGLMVAPAVIDILPKAPSGFAGDALLVIMVAASGLAAFKLHKAFLIAFTSVIGGFGSVVALHLLVHHRFDARPRDIRLSYRESVDEYWAAILIMIAGGIIWQLRRRRSN